MSTRWYAAAARWVGACAALAALGAPALAAQTDVEELGRARGGARPPAGYYEMLRLVPGAFQFSPDNGWIRRSHSTAVLRSLRRAQLANLAAAGAPLRVPQATVAGRVHMPVLLALYDDTDSLAIEQNLPRDSLERRLYGVHQAPPYSVYSYYRELSHDLLEVTGTVLPWTRVTQSGSFYEGGGTCQGLCSNANVDLLIRELVQAHDSAVDFGQYDNDGPDGVPNSGDDDGRVDALVIIHPDVDGSCRAVNPAAETSIWAHRWSYAAWAGTTLATNDTAAAGGVIRVNDYIIQGGQGGDGVPVGRGGCESLRPQSMGVVAHETGHLFDVPDLYDTRGNNSGIGRWGLMGAGNQQMPYRPVHMEAWSQARLGWVTEAVVARDTTLTISPVETSDTAYVIPIANSSEYFLVENRQRIGSDSLLIQPGLLIWHIDTVLLRSREPTNTVNAYLPHAVSLEQADGWGDLQSGQNRGDEGDPFPGAHLRRAFGPFTTPSSARNNGMPTHVSIDSIEVVPGSQAVRARLQFLSPSWIAATDTMAEFRLDGTVHRAFGGFLTAGTIHTLEMDSIQVVNAGGNRYRWVSWSNGQPRQHSFTSSVGGDTIVATVSTEYLLSVSLGGTGGTVTAAPAVDPAAGTFLAAGTTATLTASVTQQGYLFEGWSGDTVTAASLLTLSMNRPWHVVATFAAPLTVEAASVPGAVMGTAYHHVIAASGGTGTFRWERVSGALPEGMALTASGALAGMPSATGSFPFTARVTSGSQFVERSYTLEVAAPALTVEDILRQLVGIGQSLDGNEVNYLDLLGNRNGRFDVGDFLAWVEATNAASAPELTPKVAGGNGRVP